ncbi:YheC/YheD family protein [Candidatus Clostridium stratigraminis]|uniref:YheC/YheD family protein n=1 Tax=Candidatus Clostridium stratigraminis TaxID=3381661 RepID=A0ABW8T6E9_9CLOT
MEVRIKRFSNDTNSNECILPKSIFDALKLSTKESYTIHFCQSTQEILISFSEVDDINIYFSENLFNQLQLLENTTLNIWKTDKDIFIGPVVGIFVDAGRKKAAIRKPDSFIRQHMRASGAENCISYFFSASDVDWLEEKVKGVTYIPNLRKYDYYWFPLPDVLYDRVLEFNEKERLLIKEARKRFRNNPKIKLLNDFNDIGKWELYEVLSKYPESKKYVPETIIYNNFDDVLYMLNKNELIFIKSFYGTQGKEVLSIEKFNDKFKLNFYKDGAREILLDSINKVQEFVINFALKKKYIVQQGIKLLTYKGRSMDIRMFIMKNETGMWETIFKGVRIAKEGFPLTNIHAGGVYAIYDRLYSELMKQYSSVELPSTQKLSEVTIMLTNYIEKELGHYGELGIDIGIDILGQIWIIEANVMPGKRMQPYSLDIDGNPLTKLIPLYYEGSKKDSTILPQALGIFKYAKFLTGVSKL